MYYALEQSHAHFWETHALCAELLRVHKAALFAVPVHFLKSNTERILYMSNASDICIPGLLVPDLPMEETVQIRAACERAGLELVLLTTPTTPQARMSDIARLSQGFVYLVSVTGVTGVKENMESRWEALGTAAGACCVALYRACACAVRYACGLVSAGTTNA